MRARSRWPIWFAVSLCVLAVVSALEARAQQTLDVAREGASPLRCSVPEDHTLPGGLHFALLCDPKRTTALDGPIFLFAPDVFVPTTVSATRAGATSETFASSTCARANPCSAASIS